MSQESESEDDLLEQAHLYKATGRYPKSCALNRKRSIRRKADALLMRNGETYVQKKANGKVSVSELTVNHYSVSVFFLLHTRSDN